MRATAGQIEEMITDILKLDAPTTVRRQDILRRVQDRLRQEGLWEVADDAPSRSPNGHTIGEANIDWRISKLNKDQVIENPAWGRWTMATGGGVDESAFEQSAAANGYVYDPVSRYYLKDGKVFNRDGSEG